MLRHIPVAACIAIACAFTQPFAFAQPAESDDEKLDPIKYHPAMMQKTVGTKVFVGLDTKWAFYPLKQGNQTICTLDKIKWPCVVEKVEGNWYWIGDTKFHGWAQKEALISIDEALSQYSGRLRQDPNGYNYSNRGLILWGKGENDLAIKDFNQAIRLMPGDGRPFKHRAEAFLSKDDVPHAIDDLTHAIPLLNPYPFWQYEAYRLRAIANEKQGDAAASSADRSEAERLKASIMK